MLEKCLEKTTDFVTVANVATMMRHQGILSDKVMQIVASFITSAPTMPCDELSHFTAMLLSVDMQRIVNVESNIHHLEEAIIKNLHQMSPDNFATIFYALTVGQEIL